MERIKNKGISFDTGIEKVIRSPIAPSDLGPRSDVAPARAPTRPQLEQLYSLPNLEDYMAQALAPEVNEAELLLPRRFNAALRSALVHLRAAAAADPRSARTLGKGARSLADQVALRDLLEMYQNALVKG